MLRARGIYIVFYGKQLQNKTGEITSGYEPAFVGPPNVLTGPYAPGPLQGASPLITHPVGE